MMSALLQTIGSLAILASLAARLKLRGDVEQRR